MKTEPNTLVHLLKLSAQKYGDAPAILAPNSMPLTFKRLLALIEEVHHYLNTVGLGTNSRIASVLPNTPEAASAFMAISASCTFAPLNPAYTNDEFEFYISSLNVAAIITLQGFESPVRQIARKLAIPILVLVPAGGKGAGYFTLKGETGLPARDAGYAGAQDIAMLLHTSGSTAAPKIVPFRQQAICLAFNAANCHRIISSQDRCLNALPLFHMQGLLAVVNPLIFGGSCVYASPFESQRFVEWLDEFDPTYYGATPTMHQAILEQVQLKEKFHKNPSLRFLAVGSGSLPLTQISALEAVFEVPVIEAYGMTETIHISGNPLPPKIRKPGSAGIATDTEITIVDDSCEPVAPGAIGEIVVKSSWIMTGYINNELANESAFCAKGFRTGDIGYLDQEGYLFITGRVKEIINRGGEKISPYEVEQILLAHPAIKEAVAFPVPHPTLGENVAAVVVVNEDAQVEPETIRRYARERLAEFKVPYRILISEHIPKGATGKIQRHKMAAFFAEQLDAEKERLDQPHVVDNIELGEIEATLRQHHEILDAVAQTRDVGLGKRILIAFIIGKEDISVTPMELIDFLIMKLPTYLVPERLYLVKSYPLDSSGKVDRNALQNVPLPVVSPMATYQKPYHALQATLLNIWSELLGTAEIGINENFFELGGDSLKAATMRAKIEARINWSVPLPLIYSNPTVELLAQAMLQHKGENLSSSLIEIQTGTSGPPFFFMHGDFHGGGYYCYSLAKSMGPEQAFYVVQPHGLPGRPPPTTIEDMAGEYLALIRASFPEGPYFLGGHCNGALIAFEIARRLLDDGSKVGLLVMMDAPAVQKLASNSDIVAQPGAVSMESKTASHVELDKLFPVARHNAVMRLYGDICKKYVPKFYRDKLTLFMANDTLDRRYPSLGWEKMAVTTELHVVPGNHVTMLTAHTSEIAKKLMECKREVEWN